MTRNRRKDNKTSSCLKRSTKVAKTRKRADKAAPLVQHEGNIFTHTILMQRNAHYQLLRRLQESGARLIAFEMEPRLQDGVTGLIVLYAIEGTEDQVTKFKSFVGWDTADDEEDYNELIGFYRGECKDAAGRYIKDIWAFDHAQLEDVHDYIQWLFPSAKPSQFNAKAPLLTDKTIKRFQCDAKLKLQLSKSLTLMLDFYGLGVSLQAGAIIVCKAANYTERKANWQDAMPGYLNHNLLRLTRILEALNVLGLPNESAALYRCLAEIQKEESAKIPAKTLHFWQLAAGVSNSN